MSEATLELRLGLFPRQMEALRSPATEILFGGASEGGKSHFVRVMLISFCLAVKELQCVLIRKKIDDILKNHVYGPTGFLAMLKPLIDAKQVVVTQKDIKFKNGSLISFVHCQDERQFDSAQGVEKHILAIDEATQISERLIRTFRAWCRNPPKMSDDVPEMYRRKLPLILYTANPVGPSVPFFRRNFVKARSAFDTAQVDGFLRQYIPSKVEDNHAVDIEAHRGRLAGLGDPALAKALDEGDWDAPVGEYFPEWDEARHVVPNFTPPAHWFRFRTFDWGGADPFAVYWFAVSDGEQFETECWLPNDGILTKQRVKLWFPRSALVVYREWYGCNPEDPAKGIRMRNEEIASGILERSTAPEEQNLETLTDSFPFPDRGESDGKTIAQVFADSGVILTKGKTSRVTGWSQMRSRLVGIQPDPNKEDRLAMLYIMGACKYAREYIPALSRHKTLVEDAVMDGEATHSCDAIRLGCMANEIVIDAPAKPRDTANLSNQITFKEAIAKVEEINAGADGRGW